LKSGYFSRHALKREDRWLAAKIVAVRCPDDVTVDDRCPLNQISRRSTRNRDCYIVEYTETFAMVSESMMSAAGEVRADAQINCVTGGSNRSTRPQRKTFVPAKATRAAPGGAAQQGSPSFTERET